MTTSPPLPLNPSPITSPQSQSQSHRPPFLLNSTRMPPRSFLFISPAHPYPSLLERPENHHMIRWDPAGEHIIVERPEQLALHVLPSIYRQSRFASFSRQLNVSLLSKSRPTQLSQLYIYKDLRFHAQS